MVFFLAIQKIKHFLVIPMATVRINPFNFSIHWIYGTVDGYLAIPSQDLSSEGGGCTISNRQDGILWISDVIGQVVLDRPASIIPEAEMMTDGPFNLFRCLESSCDLI